MGTQEEQTLGFGLAAERCPLATSTCQSLTRTAKHERERYHCLPLRALQFSEPLQHHMSPVLHWFVDFAGSAGGIGP